MSIVIVNVKNLVSILYRQLHSNTTTTSNHVYPCKQLYSAVNSIQKGIQTVRSYWRLRGGRRPGSWLRYWLHAHHSLNTGTFLDQIQDANVMQTEYTYEGTRTSVIGTSYTYI